MALPASGLESHHDEDVETDREAVDQAAIDDDLEDEDLEDENLEEDEEVKPDPLVELESRFNQRIDQSNQTIMNQLGQMQQGMNPQKTPLSDADLNEMYKKNPVAVQRYLIEQNSQVSSQDLGRKMDKTRFDDEARAKYPLGDSKFRPVLEKKYGELLNAGMPDGSPQILLMAAKQAAAELGMQKQKVKTTRLSGGSNDTVEMSRTPRARKGDGASAGRLPAEFQNQVDLYAASGVTENQIKNFTKQVTTAYKASKKRSRA